MGFETSFSVTAFSLRLQLNSSHVFFSSLSSLLDSLFCLCLVYSITSSILALCDPLVLLLFSTWMGPSAHSEFSLVGGAARSADRHRDAHFLLLFALGIPVFLGATLKSRPSAKDSSQIRK
ncbi:hypothetical protein E4U30_004585 [Claviceps sp. LM220 group G6]|nr:hypothetical protein E4U30_004585 [Claviceps sp. LM220 group G6]